MASTLRIVPITFAAACDFVASTHRRLLPSTSWRFGIAVREGERLCGVAMCGRPTNRHSDDGLTLEVNRLATDGTPNAASKLLGAVTRIGREMGYARILTYTVEGESGASLRAAGWKATAQTGIRPSGTTWARKDRNPGTPEGRAAPKTRWEAPL